MFRGEFDAMLYVADVPRSVAYYRDVLGFRLDGYWSDETHEYVSSWDSEQVCNYAVLRAGEQKVALHRAGEDAPTPTGGGAVFHLRVEDVDAYRERTAGAGAEPSPCQDQPWGWRMFFLRDPDGHPWGFFTPQNGS